jgi:hypothetical protein
MAKKLKKPVSLDEQFAQFEADNPNIAEALRLFGMTMEIYQDALTAMEGPRVYQSTSTAPIRDKDHYAYMESRNEGDRSK